MTGVNPRRGREFLHDNPEVVVVAEMSPFESLMHGIVTVGVMRDDASEYASLV